MPNIHDLLEQLHEVGVVIVDEDSLIFKTMQASSWTAEFARLAVQGRKEGVRLERHPDVSDGQLHHILRGYPFTDKERGLVVQNVIKAISYNQLRIRYFDDSNTGEMFLEQQNEGTRKAWAAMRALNNRRGFDDWLEQMESTLQDEIFSDLRAAIAAA